jgi:hypothetical protein
MIKGFVDRPILMVPKVKYILWLISPADFVDMTYPLLVVIYDLKEEVKENMKKTPLGRFFLLISSFVQLCVMLIKALLPPSKFIPRPVHVSLKDLLQDRLQFPRLYLTINENMRKYMNFKYLAGPFILNPWSVFFIPVRSMWINV